MFEVAAGPCWRKINIFISLSLSLSIVCLQRNIKGKFIGSSFFRETEAFHRALLCVLWPAQFQVYPEWQNLHISLTPHLSHTYTNTQTPRLVNFDKRQFNSSEMGGAHEEQNFTAGLISEEVVWEIRLSSKHDS